MSDPVLCLASASPRRSELLRQIGVSHRVAAANVDETPRIDEPPADYVARVARAKAEHIAADPARSGALPVLAADTSVVLDGRVLGKPADAVEAVAMIDALSGREHIVLSAVALQLPGRPLAARLSLTRVRFRAVRAAEAWSYWDRGEPRDKAGGYAIQGYAAVFIERIDGSYSGVMGLPLFETAALLADGGIL